MIYSKQFVAWRSNAIAREVFIKLLEKVYYLLSSTVAHLKNILQWTVCGAKIKRDSLGDVY